MKTKIKVIAPEEEERAELFVHKEDREIKSLGRYLELEQFRRGILMTAVQVIIGTKVQFVADEFKKLCK